MPTTRRSPRRRAHFSVSTPSPQPTSSSDVGSACTKSSSSVRSKPAMRRRTTGFVEPYLSYVLPVTMPSASVVVTGAGMRSDLDGLSLLGLLPGVRAGRRRLGGGGAGLVVRRRDVELELDAPDALEDALGHDPLREEQVPEDAESGEHDRRVEEHGAEDQ